MSDPIRLVSDVPIVVTGRNDTQLALDDQVYMWSADTAEYKPQHVFERLVTHAVTGDFAIVFDSDGSPVWH